MSMLPSADHVAYAVVHSDPPDVFIAESAEVLTRIIALEVVARSAPSDFRDPQRASVIRTALLEEEWTAALAEWIEQTGTPVDAYPDEHIWTEQDLDEERFALELRVTPLFRDSEAGAD